MTTSDPRAHREPNASLGGGNRTAAAAPKGALLERALGLVTEVRAGEAPLSLTLALNVFLLLTAYYVIKPVREALILELDSGAEYKSYMSAAIALTLLIAVPAYGRLVDRLSRVRLVVGVTLFFAFDLLLFFAASRFDGARASLGLVFYVWVGVFNMMLVAQLWSFATDLFDSEQGKRLLPLVALGASLGAAFGSKIAAWTVGPLGVYATLLVAAGLLVLCAGLFVLADRLAESSSPAPPARASVPPTPAANDGGFALVLRHPYLLAIALFTLCFSFANTNGEYLLGRLVKAAAAQAVATGALDESAVGPFIGRTYGEFYFGVNVLGVLLQTFVVSRVVRLGGLSLAISALPVIMLLSAASVLVVPALAVLRIGKTLENATDYSLNNTVRQLFWLPTTRAMKFKAKQAIDTFVVRAGDVSSAILVYVGTGSFAWSTRAFAVTNIVLASLCVVLALGIARLNRGLAAGPERETRRPQATPRTGDHYRDAAPVS